MLLYRHHVELQLKRLIPHGAFLIDQGLSESDRKLLRSSHRLDRLWARFEPILRRVQNWKLVGITGEQIEGIASYILQLHQIDKQSYNFRYEITPAGKPSIPDKEKLRHINIRVFAEAMETLANYLFGIGEAFHESFQAKCEMENEARAQFNDDYGY